VDSVHRVVELFHRFLIKKYFINSENSPALEILQKRPELFQNYILVSKNLRLGPCLTFYIYNYVIFLIISVYFISYLTY
jgi:hypothetical protein